MRLFKLGDNSDIGELEKALGISGVDNIDVVGSGGKTSLIYSIAKHRALLQKKVIIGTSTKMYADAALMPASANSDDIEKKLNEDMIALVGKNIGGGKIGSLEGRVDWLYSLCDTYISESDGSRALPLKFPASYEPCVSKAAKAVVVVIGMNGYAKCLGEVCHRWQLLKQSEALSDLSEHTIADESILAALLTEYIDKISLMNPRAKISILLNAVDGIKAMEGAKRLIAILSKAQKNVNGRKILIACSSFKLEKNRKIDAIFMASGLSKRFGENKLVYELNGFPLYLHGLRALLSAAQILKQDFGIGFEIVVVSSYDEIIENAKDLGLLCVKNLNNKKGKSECISLGIRTLNIDTSDYLFMPADQPFIKASSIAELVLGYLKSSLDAGACSICKKPCSPRIFSSDFRCKLLSIEGDEGGSKIFDSKESPSYFYEISDFECTDIDCKQDLGLKSEL